MNKCTVMELPRPRSWCELHSLKVTRDLPKSFSPIPQPGANRLEVPLDTTSQLHATYHNEPRIQTRSLKQNQKRLPGKKELCPGRSPQH